MCGAVLAKGFAPTIRSSFSVSEKGLASGVPGGHAQRIANPAMVLSTTSHTTRCGRQNSGDRQTAFDEASTQMQPSVKPRI